MLLKNGVFERTDSNLFTRVWCEHIYFIPSEASMNLNILAVRKDSRKLSFSSRIHDVISFTMVRVKPVIQLIILLQWCHQEPLLLVIAGALHVIRSIHACFPLQTLLNMIALLLIHDPHGRQTTKVNPWDDSLICASTLLQLFWHQGLFWGSISRFCLFHEIVENFRVSEIKVCQQIPFAQCWENLLFKHCYHSESGEMIIKGSNDRNIIDWL